MSELNFPKNPIVGQEYTFNSLLYMFDGVKWVTKGTGYNPVQNLYEMLASDTGASFVGVNGYDNVQAALDANTNFVSKFDREALRRSYAEAGYELVPGSFEDGGTVSAATDVLLYASQGKAYAWGGALSKVVPPSSTPASTGGFVPGAWVDRSDVTLRSDLAAAGGAGLVGFLQYGEGAVQRTVKNRLLDCINVKDFGALGDGVTDDSAAIQAAVNSGAEFIYVPAGTYFLLTPIQLPATDITLCGTGRASKFKGSAPQLIKYPLSAAGLQFVNDLAFIVSADKVGIQMHKVWNAAGKQEVGVSRCHFYSNSANATFISVKGIWSGRIQDNQFYGNSRDNNRYGVLFVTDDNMNSSVMNMEMTGNKFVLVAYPFYYDGRTISAGGRVEGLSFNNNKSIAGKIGLRLVATLASVISGNMFHDNEESAIELNGDFDFVISGNGELYGYQQAILIKGPATSIAERGAINGNKISAGNGKNGIVIRGAGSAPRSISITGNMIGGTAAAQTGVGVKIESVTNVSNLSVCGNAFHGLDTAVDRGGQLGTMAVNGNSYMFVTNVGAGNQSTPFIESHVVTIVGGATTETITIAVPVGLTSVKPRFANAVATGTSVSSRIIAFYDFDASSATELKFNIARLDGGSLTPGGVLRFGIFANMV